MVTELEIKLRDIESAIKFFRNNLISDRSLSTILIDLYNFLENSERESQLIPTPTYVNSENKNN